MTIKLFRLLNYLTWASVVAATAVTNAPTLQTPTVAIDKRQQQPFQVPDYQIKGPLDPKYLKLEGGSTEFIGPNQDYLTVLSSGTETATAHVAIFTGKVNDQDEYSLVISPDLQKRLNDALAGNQKRGPGDLPMPDFLSVEITIGIGAIGAVAAGVVGVGLLAIPVALIAANFWMGLELTAHAPLAQKLPNPFLQEFEKCTAKPQRDCPASDCKGDDSDVCTVGEKCPCKRKCPAETKEDPVLQCNECGGPQSGDSGKCTGLTAHDNLWKDCYCYGAEPFTGFASYGDAAAVQAAIQELLSNPGSDTPSDPPSDPEPNKPANLACYDNTKSNFQFQQGDVQPSIERFCKEWIVDGGYVYYDSRASMQVQYPLDGKFPYESKKLVQIQGVVTDYNQAKGYTEEEKTQTVKNCVEGLGNVLFYCDYGSYDKWGGDGNWKGHQLYISGVAH
ncbi:hypothetical protein EJ05DRAFT_522746 [Pseudovirgaria hyperparasitica]|uniref:Uncharacterized protein n=1 Tax=Pseudovirgaria hyperparasitica TaxID=470096 RepID=A0A6A6VTU3_9PEZI|nr:uncharacterized protein EJ05DRAFT_522746 [Pseudovirgaria hyperparasitica]KAF2753309.1 hypothetical protein EJ05DRAFT_522746 [Pseudovirgaria hyperparasitica]